MIELKLKLPKHLEKDFRRIAMEKFDGSKEDALLQALTEFIDAENTEAAEREAELRKMSIDLNRKKKLELRTGGDASRNVPDTKKIELDQKAALDKKMVQSLLKDFNADT